jgi:hypothetical protein
VKSALPPFLIVLVVIVVLILDLLIFWARPVRMSKVNVYPEWREDKE